MSEKNSFGNHETFIGRRYNDARERAAACNSSLIIGITIFYIIISIFAIMELIRGIDKGAQYFLIVTSFLFTVTNWIIYLKDKKSEKFYKIVTYMYLFIYIISLLVRSNEFLQFSVVALFILAILFYDLKCLLLFSLITFVTNVVHIIKWINDFYNMNHTLDYVGLSDIAKTQMLHKIFELIILLCILYTVVRTGSRGKMFNCDIVGTISDEHDKQKEILGDVLAIAEVIQKNTTASNAIVVELGESTEIVNTAVSQISQSTQQTAVNIQEQNVMTQSIQNSINETVNRSKKMVSIANESSTSIGSSLVVMNGLKSESEQIALTNKNLIASMSRLQEKTKEVQDIAEIINNITDQTNLLSLNASIESARAGEAGKGFAVVANEIRKLAEQTKTSTENIAKILQELNNYAEEATKTVNDTIHASNYQSELIADASENFNKINENVTMLSEDIGNIDKMLVSLANANRTIVENISQISATTEEVTASSQEAAAISEKNAMDAENAKTLLNEVLETSYRLDKYFK